MDSLIEIGLASGVKSRFILYPQAIDFAIHQTSIHAFSMRRIPVFVLLFLLAGLTLGAQDFLLDRVDLNENGTVSIGFEADALSYYALSRSTDLTSFEEILNIQFGVDGPFEMSDILGGLIGGSGFYQIHRVDIANPIDMDNDGIDDVTELNSSGNFNPLDPLDGHEDFDLDGAINSKEIADGTDPFVAEDPLAVTISSVSPTLGEQHVSPVRQVRVNFDGPINPDSATQANVFLLINNTPIAAIVKVSSTERVMTIEPVGGFPPATVIQVAVAPDTLVDRNGKMVDADVDGEPGGGFTYFFETLSLERIDNTNVFGFVKDSYSGLPIEGATIRVDAFEEANAVTDAEGRFELMNMPAPEFFVHIDGSTATNAPEGKVYPVVGKPFHSSAGETVQLNHNGEVFDIFLPPMDLGDVVDLSDTEATDVGFGDGGKSELAILFPEVDPSTWDLLSVSFPPGSAMDRSGVAATQASIIPVPPDRTPSPIPVGMNTPLVISIQAPGATQFDVPAPITFPNLEGTPPGSSTFLASFDHDAGEWKTIGTGTVSEDGSVIVSDPGVGIVAPGWHVIFCAVTGINIVLPDDELGNGIFLGVPDIFEAPWWFDFGASYSPLTPGYLRITPETLYNAEIGYGWGPGLIGAVVRGARDDLNLKYDFNETRDAMFYLDVEPGFYDLCISLGDPLEMRSLMEVWIEGILVGQVSADELTNCKITYTNIAVSDGQMNIQFRSGGEDRVAVSGLEINFVKQGYSPGQQDLFVGTFCRLRVNEHTDEEFRDVISLENFEILLSDFMDPYTPYKQWVFHKETMKVGFREWCTPGKAILMEIPTYSFGFPPPFDSDQDGLYDLIEFILGFDPENPDSDGDGIGDFEEIYGPPQA